MRLEPAGKAALERGLFDFLRSLGREASPAPGALTAKPDTLRALRAAPHPALLEALGRRRNGVLAGMGLPPGPARPAGHGDALALALAFHNRLACVDLEDPDGREAVSAFTDALVAALRPPRDLEEALSAHAVLEPAPDLLRALGPAAGAGLTGLLEASPLTGLVSLDLHTPCALDGLAVACLGPRAAADGPRPPARPGAAEAWLRSAAGLVEDPAVGRWVRRRWLGMAENRLACRNLGLFLEALRRLGGCRDFILAFYESYDYFRAAKIHGGRRRQRARFWPLLETIEKLLTVSGQSEAAIRMNRRGNEYFMKFRPLVAIIVEENGIPADYAHLTPEFVDAIRPLLDFATQPGGGGLAFTEAQFREG